MKILINDEEKKMNAKEWIWAIITSGVLFVLFVLFVPPVGAQSIELFTDDQDTRKAIQRRKMDCINRVAYSGLVVDLKVIKGKTETEMLQNNLELYENVKDTTPIWYLLEFDRIVRKAYRLDANDKNKFGLLIVQECVMFGPWSFGS